MISVSSDVSSSTTPPYIFEQNAEAKKAGLAHTSRVAVASNLSLGL